MECSFLLLWKKETNIKITNKKQIIENWASLELFIILNGDLNVLKGLSN